MISQTKNFSAGRGYFIYSSIKQSVKFLDLQIDKHLGFYHLIFYFKFLLKPLPIFRSCLINETNIQFLSFNVHKTTLLHMFQS